jgi:hypothetical protein
LGTLAITLATLALAMMAGGPAVAHSGAAGALEAVALAPTIDLSDPTRASIDWSLSNNTGRALTIHGLASPRAAKVTLLRRRALFGLESYQPVDFLRIEADERLRLASPEYVLSFEGLAPSGMTLVLVTLDLGPDGQAAVGMVEPLPGDGEKGLTTEITEEAQRTRSQ